jgi:hypothetical protein
VNGGTGPARPSGDDRAPDHDQYDVLAAAWALHALEPDEEALFVEHLPGCEACRRTVAELDATLVELAYAAPSVAPPAALLGKLHAAVAAEAAAGPSRAEEGATPTTSGPGTVVPLRPRQSFRDRAVRWVAVAAAVAAVVFAGWNVSLQRDMTEQRKLTAQRDAMLGTLLEGQRLAALPPADGKGRPVAYVFRRDGQLEVATHGMGRNAAGKDSYWVWAIWDGQPRPLGRFDVHTADMDFHTVGSLPPGVEAAKGFAVSLEPGTARPVKPSRIVAVGAADR